MSDNLPDFLNDNPGVVGAGVGLALRRQLQGIQAQAEKAEKERKRALEHERRRKDALSQDKNIVFKVAKDLEALASCPVPFEALQQLHALKQLLRQRKITPERFDEFEDKTFAQQVFDRLEACEEKYASQAVSKELARRKEDIHETLDTLEILSGMQPCAAVYLRIEQLINGFKKHVANVNAFSSNDDKELVIATEQKLLTERDRVFTSLSTETVGILQSLKSWVQLNGLLDGLSVRGRQMADLKETISVVAVPAMQLSAWEMATRNPAIIYSASAIGAVGLIGMLGAIVGLVHSPPNQMWIVAGVVCGLAGVLMAIFVNPFKTLSERLSEQRLADEARAQTLAHSSEKLRALEHEQSLALEVVGDLNGIPEDIRNYLMQVEFGGSETEEFKQSAEKYISELQVSLGLDPELLIALVVAGKIS